MDNTLSETSGVATSVRTQVATRGQFSRDGDKPVPEYLEEQRLSRQHIASTAQRMINDLPRFALYLPPREGEVVPMYIGRARGIAVSKKPDLQVATELLEITGPLADYFHARGLRRLAWIRG
jgi:hypothetical protein